MPSEKKYLIVVDRVPTSDAHHGFIWARGVKQSELAAREREAFAEHAPCRTYHLPEGEEGTTIAKGNPTKAGRE